jgi:glucose/arabinose dehydrogenase/mono/diheme cytochrome c family protein
MSSSRAPRGSRLKQAKRAPWRLLRLALALAVSGPLLGAPQNGDVPGEEQPRLPAELEIPAAPVLSVEEALASFVLAPGLEIECVASEPLVVDPVDLAFDGEGRGWVVEMRGYMPDIDGGGEDAANGRVTVLHDEDADGVFDKRVDFLTGLVMPRAVLPYRDGALVIVPPELRFYHDGDGDGAADDFEVLATGLGGLHSPEHAINAPRWSQDNWIHFSHHSWRFREDESGWQRQATAGGGQWGLSFDATGRAFFNTNSDALRGDAYSSHYAVRNPNHGLAAGTNQRLCNDQTVWPLGMTPGVNRGYRPETLRDDYSLRSFTGACAPLIFLGDGLPSAYRGRAFVAEPCGNLVKCLELREQEQKGGALAAIHVFAGAEFLASRDERFRPVSLRNGPDGALYVVDMYRGVIQHRLFVTSWLRAQVEARGLATPLGLGRIWRISAEGEARKRAPALGQASWTELVAELGHSNGWRRITAQQVIVEEGVGDSDAIELCRQAVAERPTALARVHGLWALAGLGALDPVSVLAGLSDTDGGVRLAALRCGEALLATGDKEILARVAAIARGADVRLAHQARLSLGEAHTISATAVMVELAREDVSTAFLRSALISGLHGEELEFLTELLGETGWEQPIEGRFQFVELLARCVAREGRSDRIELLLGLLLRGLEGNAWHASAVVRGLLAGRPLGPLGQPASIRLISQPAALTALVDKARGPSGEELEQLIGALTWPGGPGADGQDVRPLTPQELSRFERGRLLYAEVCRACHGSSGLGEAGKAPPLRNSPWLLGSKKTPIRILVGGMRGPIELNGQRWDLEMPVYQPSPAHVAAVLTYARREWGHGADPITAADVLEVAENAEKRTSPWTVEELAASD